MSFYCDVELILTLNLVWDFLSLFSSFRGFYLSILTARQLPSMATEELKKSPPFPPYPQVKFIAKIHFLCLPFLFSFSKNLLTIFNSLVHFAVSVLLTDFSFHPFIFSDGAWNFKFGLLCWRITTIFTFVSETLFPIFYTLIFCSTSPFFKIISLSFWHVYFLFAFF